MYRLLLIFALFFAYPVACLAAEGDCADALVLSTYKVSSANSLDYSLASHVTKDQYEKLTKSATGATEIYGVPVAGSYEEFHSNAEKLESSVNINLSESQIYNLEWTGIDEASSKDYITCIETMALSNRGIHLSVRAATDRDISIVLGYVAEGHDHSTESVVWSMSEKDNTDVSSYEILLPKKVTAGRHIFVLPRPKKQMQIAVNIPGSADVIVLEPTIVAPAVTPPKPTVISFSAANFVQDRTINVVVGAFPAEYGADVLTNAPPYGEQQNDVYYQFEATAEGDYELDAEYAAATSRPAAISVDGMLVTQNGFSATTGGWDLAHQQWRAQGIVHLLKGHHDLFIQRGGSIPHLHRFMFKPIGNYLSFESSRSGL